MFTLEERKAIARIIVAGASIDGTLNSHDRESLSKILNALQLTDVLAEVGFALDHDFGDFDIFHETKILNETLGERAKKLTPIIFEIITQCVSGDRFVSAQEATFLSTLARRLKLSTHIAGKILKGVLESKRSKLEINGDQIDALLHPHLKELLSFSGSEDLVGEIHEDSIEERLYQAQQELQTTDTYAIEDIQSALITLGLNSSSSIEDAKDAWASQLEEIKLHALLHQGPAFVSAALQRAGKINEAYLLLTRADSSIREKVSHTNEIEKLEGEIKRNQEYKKHDLEEDLANAFSVMQK